MGAYTNQCSTPFGIIGILTFPAWPVRRLVDCAQRLSASSEFSRNKRRTVFDSGGGCSTPFGIIGILTVTPSTASLTLSSAQRLSASSEFSLRVESLYLLR